ncbi:MAG: hypothetical protein ACR2OU_05800, partial [Thermomicrobiales bacterium]
LWMLPSHGHMLFVGWFVQFALGIAYWLLPRKRSPDLPLGYNERIGIIAAIALNAGLIFRVLCEPFERTGHASNLTLTGLSISALLQVLAGALFVSQVWPRIIVKERLGTPKSPQPLTYVPAQVLIQTKERVHDDLIGVVYLIRCMQQSGNSIWSEYHV